MIYKASLNINKEKDTIAYPDLGEIARALFDDREMEYNLSCCTDEPILDCTMWKRYESSNLNNISQYQITN